LGSAILLNTEAPELSFIGKQQAYFLVVEAIIREVNRKRNN
jgi:hypothetical protein